jgi:hypothetical protein
LFQLSYYCFNFFVDIGKYLSDELPQRDEDMEEAKDQPTIHRYCMARRMDQRVLIKVVDHLCGVMISHLVVPTSVKNILWISNISTIWTTLP